jgi:hypothetical protein
MKTKIIHLSIWKLGHFNVLALAQKGRADVIHESFHFNEDAIYRIGNDQGDWNKLIGLGKYRFDHQKASVMVGWRWNPGAAYFEFIPYIHDEQGKVFKFWEQQPLQIRVDSDLDVYLTPTSITLTSGKQRITYEIPTYARSLSNELWFKITSWFGGNKTPDRKVVIYEGLQELSPI